MGLPARDRTPTWYGDPHRLLFPLGAVLGATAVLPFALGGRGGGSLALFHSVAQIQGFLSCFAMGALFALVPRWTGTPGPRAWQVAGALAIPSAAVACGWAGTPALASWIWLGLVVLALGFTAPRLWRRARREPVAPAVLWLPASLVAGAGGAILVALGSRPSLGDPLELWTLGRGLLVQGFASGLVLGLGGLVPPSTEEGAGRPPGPGRRGCALLAQGLAAAAFFGSFPLDLAGGPRLGFAVRAAVAAAVLGATRLQRPPALRGRLAWLAAWLVPAGFTLGAAAEGLRGAALHVLFVGGFAQMALATSTHLLLDGGPRAAGPLRAMAILLAAAFASRIAAALDAGHVASWLAVAATSFVAALAAWAVVVGPALLAGPARRPAGR